MYADLLSFVEDFGAAAPGRSPDTSSKPGIAVALRRGLMSEGILPGSASLEFEFPDDAVIILTDGEMAELSYPFDEYDVREALYNLADALG